MEMETIGQFSTLPKSSESSKPLEQWFPKICSVFVAYYKLKYKDYFGKIFIQKEWKYISHLFLNKIQSYVS